MLATSASPWSAYVGYNLTFEQFQARYLFTALVADRHAAGARLGGLAAAARSRPWGVACCSALALVGLERLRAAAGAGARLRANWLDLLVTLNCHSS